MCIAVSVLVILVDQELLVLVVEVVDKLLRTEEVAPVATLIGLLHRPLQLLLVEGAITGDVDLVDLDFLLLVDGDVEDEVIGLGHIVALHDGDIGILEALLIEVALDDNLGTVHHVGCDLIALAEVELGLQVILLRLLHTDEVDFREARALGERDVQVSLVAHGLLHGDAHVREQAVLPVALHSGCDLFARDGDHLSDRQSRQAYQHVVLVVVDTAHRDTGNLIFLGGRV